MGWLIAVLLLIVIIFGVSSGMDSYATAQQAQAMIEVAQVAQVNAWGNLVMILTIALALVIFVALVAVVLWVIYKRSAISSQRSAVSRQMAEARPQSQISVNELTQLMMLDMLRSMRAPSQPALPDQSVPSEEPVDEPFHWLK